MAPRKSNRRSGIILLVVLSMLAFLGLLVISYVAFSSSARRSASLIAGAEFREPNTSDLFSEAIMRILRGTANPQDRFYGQGIFDDYFGDQGGKTLQVTDTLRVGIEQRRPVHVGGAFVRFPIENGNGTNLSPVEQLDDYFTGRTITFLAGPLENRSFRVVRSIGARVSDLAEQQSSNSLFIELDPEMFVTLDDNSRVQISSLISPLSSPHDVGVLFYSRGGEQTPGWGENGVNDDGIGGVDNRAEAGFPATLSTNGRDIGYQIHLNPAPLNAPGLGFRTGGWLTQPVADKQVPVAFLPNRQGVDKRSSVLGGDYNESYDAADFNTSFLAGRVRIRNNDGTVTQRVIPSFHRPALINYLINLKDWTSATNAELRDVIDAISQSTYRPFPHFDVDANGDPFVRNSGFTGGSSEFGLTEPILVTNDNNQVSVSNMTRLQLLVNALINGTDGQGGWDVDADGDGTADSVWIDIGLPLITSREGKVLRPMIAVLIEDTNGKLNVNTHGFYSQTHDWAASPPRNYTSNLAGPWAGTNGAARTLLRGLGYGPADVALFPQIVPSNTTLQKTELTRDEIVGIFEARYAWNVGTQDVQPVPGHRDDGEDALDHMLNLRPEFHDRNTGYGYSVDPMGHGGVGIGRSGRLYASGSGTQMISTCLLYTSPSPRDLSTSRMPSSA